MDSAAGMTTAYYNSDGQFGDRDSTYIKNLKCQYA